MKTLKFMLIICLTLTIFSCSKDNEKNTEIPTTKDVYTAGAVKVGSNYRALYWKNNEIASYLTDIGEYSFVTDIVVTDEKTVYVIGYKIEGTESKATYWKQAANESQPTEYTLSAMGNATASEMLIKGNDIYICGYETVAGKTVAVYWKNGTKYQLTDGSSSVKAVTLAMNIDGVLFFGGHEYIGNDAAGKIWSDTYGTTTHNDGEGNCFVNSLSIPNHSIYASGSYQNPNYIVAYWEDDAPAVSLTDGTINASAYRIQVVTNEDNTNDIYLVGFQLIDGIYNVTLWKNGTPTKINDGIASGIAVGYDLFVDEEDVYIGFNENNIPKYSKNNIITTLPMDGNTEGLVRAITLK